MNEPTGEITKALADQPSAASPPLEETTMAHDASTADAQAAPPAPALESALTEAESLAAKTDADLTILEPSTKPDSLGKLGHYEVLELLGKGGFGVVLKAFDERLHRVVAIKVMGRQAAASATARKRFVREARAAAAIRDEHVVKLYDVEEHPVPYLVMEFVAGQTLEHKLRQAGRLEAADIVRIGAQIAEGLAAAHEQGQVHRDIKPANVLLESGLDQAKITDFGLARAVDDASLTRAGVIAGTPMFMSPEQARGETLDHRSDLFSLGSVLYTMCTGQPPFRDAKTMGILKRVCEHTPTPIRELNEAIPEALTTIVDQLLAKDPAARPQSAAEVVETLRRLLPRGSGETTALREFDVRRVPTLSSRTNPRFHRPGAAPSASQGKGLRLVAFGGAALTLVVALSIGFKVLRNSDDSENYRALRAAVAWQLQVAVNHLDGNEPEVARTALEQALTDVDRADVGDLQKIALRRDILRQRAEVHRRLGNLAASEADTQQVGAILQQLAAALPDNLEAALASADHWLENIPELPWTILSPKQLQSEGGALLKVQADGSILASGPNVDGDVYTLLIAPLPQPATALRLETLTDPSLPRNGPGRHESGNFQLAEISLHQQQDDAPAQENAIPIRAARASYHWTGMNVENAFDGNPNTVWHVWSRTGKNHWAIFIPAEPVAPAAGSRLVVRLRFHNREPGINLGRFRLSVTSQFQPLARDRLIALAKQSSDWRRVAAIHVLREQGAQAVAALARAESGNVELSGADCLLLALAHEQLHQPEAADQDLDRAAAWYARNPAQEAFMAFALEALPPRLQQAGQSPHWLQHRARGHAKAGRQQDAARDLARALELKPDLTLHVDDKGALTALVDMAVARSEWQRIKAPLVQLIDLDRNSTTVSQHWHWYRLGAVLAFLGEADAYRKHRTAMLDLFAETRDPEVAERTAKCGLVLPAAGDDLKRLSSLTRFAVAKGEEGHWILPWALMVRCLTEHRQNNYEAAEATLTELTRDPKWARPVLAELVVAMSLHKRGKKAEAMPLLKKATDFLDSEMPLPTSPKVIGAWHDWLFLQVLRREAEALIERQ